MPQRLPSGEKNLMRLASPKSGHKTFFLADVQGADVPSLMQAYESVRDVILRIIDDIFQSSERSCEQEEEQSWLQSVQDAAQKAVEPLQPKGQWHIYTTGHSLGGALACLCAHELAVWLSATDS